MKNSKIRIVFMGTPEFAVAPLKSLADAGFNISAIVTAADKPAGRGKKLKSSAIKEFALAKLKCPVLQAVNLKDPTFIKTLQKFKADLFVVVAFRMLPESIWTIPKHGTINLHASLLPQYRGAAPINWCIINGETETGVTTFLIDHKIDTGRILLQQSISIGPDDNAGIIHDKLMLSGAQLIVNTVYQLMAGNIQSIEQESLDIPESKLKKAPKIFPKDCRIDWNKSGNEIHNFIRGLSPFPGAFTILKQANKEALQIKIFKTKFEEKETNTTPGTIITDNRKYLKFACKGGVLEVLSLQSPGKKRLAADEFLSGIRADVNEWLAE